MDALDLDEGEIRRIARAGRERVLAEHTSEHRADELLIAIAESRSPQAPASALMEA
jgi:spore maturation protein CgeB